MRGYRGERENICVKDIEERGRIYVRI